MASIVDAFSAEDRVEVKFSDFYNLVHQAAKEELMENAVRCEVPYRYIREMLCGENDLLGAYKDTGLLPEQILAVDRLYTEVCAQAEVLMEENKQLHDTIMAAGVRNEATQENTEGNSDEEL